jgi:hypothetical protein
MTIGMTIGPRADAGGASKKMSRRRRAAARATAMTMMN